MKAPELAAAPIGAAPAPAPAPAPVNRAGIVTNCLFEEPWWLDCVAPGAWREIVAREHGRTVGRMALPMAKRWGLTSVRQPPLTQTLGPWVERTQANTAKQLAFEKEVLSDLLGQMPKVDFYSQNFHRSVTNWLPFFWHGYTANPKITYVVPDLSDPEALWQNLQSGARTDIKKARRQLEVTESDDIDEFLRVNKLTFARQGAAPSYSDTVVKRLDAACAQRGRRKILFARDEQGRHHAAVYLVMDERCTYYLMSGGDPELRNSGAGSLLIWESIIKASLGSTEFDFEGSMGESIERFFRSFGSRQAGYLNVRKSGRVVTAALALRQMAGAIRCA